MSNGDIKILQKILAGLTFNGKNLALTASNTGNSILALIILLLTSIFSGWSEIDNRNLNTMSGGGIEGDLMLFLSGFLFYIVGFLIFAVLVSIFLSRMYCQISIIQIIIIMSLSSIWLIIGNLILIFNGREILDLNFIWFFILIFIVHVSLGIASLCGKGNVIVFFLVFLILIYLVLLLAGLIVMEGGAAGEGSEGPSCPPVPWGSGDDGC